MKKEPTPYYTDWFTSKDKPARKGVYEVQYAGEAIPDKRYFSYWTGKNWSLAMATPKDALLMFNRPSPIKARIWRGVAKPL